MGKGGLFDRQRRIGFAGGVLFTIVLAWLFYDSPYGLLIGIFVIPAFSLWYEKQNNESRIRKKEEHIKEMFSILYAYLQAGYAIENAFKETAEDIKKIIPPDNQIQKPLRKMNHKMEMNQAPEKAFEEFAKEIDIEDVYRFSDVLYYAKRLGGNYTKNLQQTILKLEEKAEIRQEIQTLTAEKKLELKVMLFMPPAILLYMKTGANDFICQMYHNPTGALLMTICLFVYAGMIFWGQKIVDIEI